jgi:tRNA(fMet)-specific endonuclease VapC
LKFLIDTNIAIHARDGFEPVLERLGRHEGVVFLSALSLAELQRGLYATGADSPLRQARLRKILQTIPVLAFDATAAETYGQIIAQIGWTRRRDFDRLIAAHALATGCTLVTANSQDFSDIPGLSLENWTLAA